MSPLAQLALDFATLSLLGIGGGVAMLPELERITTVKNPWLAPQDFAEDYRLGQLAPGPNGILVLLIGYRVAGWPGALVSTLAFFIPSGLLALFAGRAWKRWAGSPWSQAVRRGLTPITVGLMLGGVWGLARAALTGPLPAGLAALVGALVLTGRINPALLVLGGGLAGWLMGP
jgi:chromate transporter